MAKGFKGMPGNMQGMLKQAQKMQADLQKVQEEAKELVAEGSSGGGMVKVEANGKHEVVSVIIDKQCVDPEDVEMLQDLIKAATNEAMRSVSEKVEEKMGQVTGGMNLPGLF
jgi:hypothetical protein